jgi:hypothetical protein
VHAARLALGHAQRSVRTAQRAAATAEDAWRADSRPGGVDAAGDALGALAAAADTQRETSPTCWRPPPGAGWPTGRGSCSPTRSPAPSRTLTDLPGLRRAAHCGARACRRAPETCRHDLTGRPGLRAPGPTDGYAPGAALDRHGRARDRRCRFPGCRRRVPRPANWTTTGPTPPGGDRRGQPGRLLHR